MDHKHKHHSRSGQAMAEFLVGLVCIMLLMVGMQQISFLSEKGFLTMNNARHQMAELYVDPPFNDWLKFNFSTPAQPGTDGQHLTADDHVPGGDDSFYQSMDGVNGIDGYVYMVFDDQIGDFMYEAGRMSPHLDLKYSGGMFTTTTALDMLYARDSQTVDAVPFMDKVLGRDTILIGRDLWMPRWDAIP